MKEEKREGKKVKKKYVGDHSTHFVQAEKASSMDMCQRPMFKAFFLLQMDTHCEAEIGRVRKVCRPTCEGSPVTSTPLTGMKAPTCFESERLVQTCGCADFV